MCASGGGRSSDTAPSAVDGVHITIKDLTYSVPSKTGKRGSRTQLLRGVTGYFEPGCMSALMGPSGSGKTTCLDMLAGRKNTGDVEGEVLFDGRKPSLSFLRCRVGYVEQFDTLLPTLTVEEMLLYTSQLTRPLSEGSASKHAAVEELLRKLGLQKCRGTKIGDSLHKGLSGGEAKRTNIAIQLLKNPSALLLDEPTSGLDSFTSNEVMTVVKALVADGVTIVATIHSPTSYAFSLFDSLMVLLSGRVAYFGRSGQAALDYVTRIVSPVDATPRTSGLGDADWLVDVYTRADREGRADVFVKAYEVSCLHRDTVALVDDLSRCDCGGPAWSWEELLGGGAVTATPWWWGLAMLFKYRTLNNAKSPMFIFPRVVFHIVLSFLLLTLYLGIGDDYSMLNLTNIAGALCMFSACPAFSAITYCPSLVLERRLFIRERHDGLYRTETYLMARMMEEVLVGMVPTVIATVIMFYGIQLQGSLVLFWFGYFSMLCTGIGTAFLIAALAPSMDVANMALPTYYGTSMFFSGFFLRLDDIPRWWKWYSYINPLRYSFTSAMVNEFHTVNPRFVKGKTFLEFYGMAGRSAWVNMAYLWVFFAVMLTATWAALRFSRYSR